MTGLSGAGFFFACLLAGVCGEELPYWTDVQTQVGSPASLLAVDAEASAWSARVGDRVYHAPGLESGLSKDIGNYFVALGSKSAMTDSMKERYVGGDGRWHIFHLPEGPSMLEIDSRKDRRSAFSGLFQLTNGAELSKGGQEFPQYAASTVYEHPLDEDGQAKEESAVNSINGHLVKDKLAQLLADGDHSSRSWKDPTAQAKTHRYLLKEFRKLGLTTCQQFFKYNGVDQTNVIGMVRGSGSPGTVTVGAHYDSRPFAGAAPGAEDNGSGVAAMLTVAEKFMKSKFVPKKSVYFVGFAAEEPGLRGSHAFAEELLAGGNFPKGCELSPEGSFLQTEAKPKKRLTAANHQAIIMDEVGWKSPNLATPTVNLESKDFTKDVMDHLAQASSKYNGDEINVVHSNNPFGSDHMSWLDHDAPAVLLINGDDEAYPNYHSKSDTIGNVDTGLLGGITKIAAAGLFRLSGK